NRSIIPPYWCLDGRQAAPSPAVAAAGRGASAPRGSAAIEFGYGEILPAGHVGDLGERFAERPCGIDSDGRGDTLGPRAGEVHRRIGRSGRQVVDDDDVL